MAFTAEAMALTIEERLELEQMVQSRTLPAGDVFRARLILMLAEGLSYRTIQERLDTTAPTISRWKERFVKGRVGGLLEMRHPGQKPSVITPALQAKVRAAGQSLRCDTTEAERWIDSLVLPQTGCATRNQQRYRAACLAAGRFEAASLGTLHGQR
jgi:hypothetical protein